MMGLGNLLLAQNYHFLLMLKNGIAQEENMINFMDKKSYALRKMKERQRRRIGRKQRGYWYDKGRTDRWCKNLLDGNLKRDVWKKNFRMSGVVHEFSARIKYIYFT